MVRQSMDNEYDKKRWNFRARLLILTLYGKANDIACFFELIGSGERLVHVLSSDLLLS